MAKLTLTSISSRYASVQALNANFDAIETALENTLSRDGTTPNTMSTSLDMNGNRLINLSAPVDNSDAVTKEYVDDTLPSLVVDASGYADAAAASASAAASSATTASGYLTQVQSDAAGATASAALAEDWANKTGGTVDGVEYSSKYYSQVSASAASDSQGYAATAATYANVGLAASSAYDFGSVTDLVVIFPTDFGSVV